MLTSLSELYSHTFELYSHAFLNFTRMFLNYRLTRHMSTSRLAVEYACSLHKAALI
jgi:hypothetical protein